MIDKEIYKKYVPNVTFKLIPANMLTSNVGYQRDCSRAFVNKMAKDFDKELVKVVRVSEREGRFYVWDGQHTVSLLVEISGFEDIPVWCMVYEGLTYEEEARLFSKQQKYFRSLTSFDITNAEIESGDQNAIRMEQIVNAYGFTLSKTLKDYGIKATSSIEGILKNYGEDAFCKALELISDTWQGRKEYLRGPFIKAVSRMIAFYSNKMDFDYFVSRFSTVSFSEIKLETKNCSPVNRMDYTKGLVTLYNKKTTKRLSMDVLKS